MADRRHSWSTKVRIAGAETITGCDQTEQRCWNCGRVKITVHPPHGLPYVAWRWSSDNPQQFTMIAMPRCVAVTATEKTS